MKTFSAVLFAFLLSASFIKREAPPAADTVIKDACHEASGAHKRVMIVFHASWCTYCHKLDSLMESPECKALFDKSYVVRHLVIMESKDKKDLENPGAQELYDKYASKNSGIPYFLIMDADGTMVADSRIKAQGVKPDNTGDNIGFPTEKAEVVYYMQVLKATTSLSDSELGVIQHKLTGK